MVMCPRSCGAALLATLLTLASGCQSPPPPQRTRAEAIPADAVKGTPAGDLYPPIVHLPEWEQPVPMPGPINTAGGEDSPFITPEGDELYFFFTPDVHVPPEKQIVDGVTGLWYSQKIAGEWSEPERILLGSRSSLDGCVVLLGDVMWFASVRQGNLGEVDVYTARLRDGRWTDIRNAGPQLNQEYDIGEFHLTADGQTLYCGGPQKWSDFQGKDLFVLQRQGDGWSAPVALPAPINTPERNEDQPFITPDGQELWFTGQSRLGDPGPAVFRSLKTADGGWGAPVEVISSLAGEPTLDAAGNIYFVHHYYTEGMQRMIEADLYVARRRGP